MALMAHQARSESLHWQSSPAAGAAGGGSGVGLEARPIQGLPPPVAPPGPTPALGPELGAPPGGLLIVGGAPGEGPVPPPPGGLPTVGG